MIYTPPKKEINDHLRSLGIDPCHFGSFMSELISKATHRRMNGTYVDDSLIIHSVKLYLYQHATDPIASIET